MSSRRWLPSATVTPPVLEMVCTTWVVAPITPISSPLRSITVAGASLGACRARLKSL